MTVPSTAVIAGPFIGTGAQANLNFAFKCFATTDVEVFRDGSQLVLGAHYSVALNADQENSPGGTVTIFAAAYTLLSNVYVALALSETQPTRLPSQSAWSPTQVEAAIDRVALLIKQTSAKLSRVPMAPLGETIGALPAKAARVGMIAAYDANGDPTVASGTGADSALRTDLAAGNGSLLGFLFNATATVARTIRSKLMDYATPWDFGAVGDGITDDTAALQAFNDWFFNDGTVLRKCRADFSGTFAISSPIRLGPSTMPADWLTKKYNVGGELKLIATAAMFECCAVKNLQGQRWHGTLSIDGTGSAVYSTRTCGVGFRIEDCGMAKFDGISARYFYFDGIVGRGLSSTGTQVIGADFGFIYAEHCGSGYTGAVDGDPTFNLRGNWSAPVNSGSALSPAQRTQLNIDTFPNALIETYEAVGAQQLHVLINGYPYFVSAWDRTAGTVSIFPWIDSTLGSSGTFEWLLGAGLSTLGDNSGIAQVSYLNTVHCGRGLGVSGLYGPRINSGNPSYNGVGVMIGAAPSSAIGATSMDAVYTEGNVFDHVFNGDIDGTFYAAINSTSEVDLSKVLQIGDLAARDGSNALNITTLGIDKSNVVFVAKGALHRPHDAPFQYADAIGTRPFTSHSRPPVIRTTHIDSQTITLTVQGSGEYNRLFGYRGGTLRFIGSGTNGAPTGSFTFAPPAGGTVNGGAVNANAVFSGFYGPVDFEVFHTDKAQLTWVVRPVAGWIYKTTVAALPAAGTVGRRAFVTDSSVTTFGTTVAAGGANKVPVYDNGTNWVVG